MIATDFFLAFPISFSESSLGVVTFKLHIKIKFMEKKVSLTLKFNPKDTLHKMLQLKIFLVYDLYKEKVQLLLLFITFLIVINNR